MSWPRQLLLIVLAFVLASALAGALGAINLGTALSFGQIAVALTVKSAVPKVTSGSWANVIVWLPFPIVND